MASMWSRVGDCILKLVVSVKNSSDSTIRASPFLIFNVNKTQCPAFHVIIPVNDLAVLQQ